MGVFNLFIVIPQIVMGLVIPQIYGNILGKDPLNVVIFGGIVMLVAAASVLVVKDVGAGIIDTLVPPEDVIAGVAE
jgi:maltose/moltooligosaccharide transporter